MKKLLALLLAAVTACSLVACGDQADGSANNASGGNDANASLTYTLSEDGTYYEVSAPRADNMDTVSVTIPETYEGLPVGIAEHAFYALTSLETVVAENVVAVQTQAFVNCPRLKSISISGETDISSRCIDTLLELETLEFGAGVRYIGSSCVVECEALKTITIGDDCTCISDYAFADLPALESVTLGKNLEYIGKQAFANSTALRSIEFPTEKTLIIEDEAFVHSGLEELHIPANLVLGSFVFKFLAWSGDEDTGYSRCKSIWFYATEPTKDNLGSNSIGYTWDRTAADDAQLGDFMIYVPKGSEAAYERVMQTECDESWDRCVLQRDRLATFEPA